MFKKQRCPDSKQDEIYELYEERKMLLKRLEKVEGQIELKKLQPETLINPYEEYKYDDNKSNIHVPLDLEQVYLQIATLHCKSYVTHSGHTANTQEYIQLLKDKIHHFRVVITGTTDFGTLDKVIEYNWKEAENIVSVKAWCYPRNNNVPFVHCMQSGSNNAYDIYSIDLKETKNYPPAWALPAIYYIQIELEKPIIEFPILKKYYESLSTPRYTIEEAKSIIKNLRRFFPNWIPHESTITLK